MKSPGAIIDNILYAVALITMLSILVPLFILVSFIALAFGSVSEEK